MASHPAEAVAIPRSNPSAKPAIASTALTAVRGLFHAAWPAYTNMPATAPGGNTTQPGPRAIPEALIGDIMLPGTNITITVTVSAARQAKPPRTPLRSRERHFQRRLLGVATAAICSSEPDRLGTSPSPTSLLLRSIGPHTPTRPTLLERVLLHRPTCAPDLAGHARGRGPRR